MWRSGDLHWEIVGQQNEAGRILDYIWSPFQPVGGDSRYCSLHSNSMHMVMRLSELLARPEAYRIPDRAVGRLHMSRAKIMERSGPYPAQKEGCMVEARQYLRTENILLPRIIQQRRYENVPFRSVPGTGLIRSTKYSCKPAATYHSCSGTTDVVVSLKT